MQRITSEKCTQDCKTARLGELNRSARKRNQRLQSHPLMTVIGSARKYAQDQRQFVVLVPHDVGLRSTVTGLDTAPASPCANFIVQPSDSTLSKIRPVGDATKGEFRPSHRSTVNLRLLVTAREKKTKVGGARLLAS